MQETITMTSREQQRAQVLNRLLVGDVTAAETAIRPGLAPPWPCPQGGCQPCRDPRRRSERRFTSRLSPYPMAIGAPNQIVATAPENRSTGTGRPEA